MAFPTQRPRRLRGSAILRRAVAETSVETKRLIQPAFVREGTGVKSEIPSMRGQYHYSIDTLTSYAGELLELGVDKLLLFGLPAEKDATGTGAYAEEGIVQRAVRALKQEYGTDLFVITDVCLCEYTDHGHCGVIHGGTVDNDATLPLLAQTAVSHAKAGADLIAPSDMMDGRVGTIREGLDAAGFSEVPILSYAVKYASAFYGPFRDAADSAPQFGDRRAYQMDPPNSREAIREARLDVEEGADMIMVKPGLPYLDIVARVRDAVQVPVVAYHVSGEYSMVRAAAEKGWINEEAIIEESFTSFFRAGCDMVISYASEAYARAVTGGEGRRPRHRSTGERT
jgi:porphobilinogen synthase